MRVDVRCNDCGVLLFSVDQLGKEVQALMRRHLAVKHPGAAPSSGGADLLARFTLDDGSPRRDRSTRLRR